MSSRFRNIKTADELEKAILYIKAKQKATGKSISKDASHLLASLKPANLISSLIPTNTLTDAGIGLIRGIRKIIAPGKGRSD